MFIKYKRDFRSRSIEVNTYQLVLQSLKRIPRFLTLTVASKWKIRSTLSKPASLFNECHEKNL